MVENENIIVMVIFFNGILSYGGCKLRKEKNSCLFERLINEILIVFRNQFNENGDF